MLLQPVQLKCEKRRLHVAQLHGKHSFSVTWVKDGLQGVRRTCRQERQEALDLTSSWEKENEGMKGRIGGEGGRKGVMTCK